MLLILIGTLLWLSSFRRFWPKGRRAQRGYDACFGGGALVGTRVFATLLILSGLLQWLLLINAF